MPDKLLNETSGISRSLLNQITANPSDVWEGNSFLASDGTIKEGEFTFSNDYFEIKDGGTSNIAIAFDGTRSATAHKNYVCTYPCIVIASAFLYAIYKDPDHFTGESYTIKINGKAVGVNISYDDNHEKRCIHFAQPGDEIDVTARASTSTSRGRVIAEIRLIKPKG